MNKMLGAIKEKWSSMNLTIHEKEINIARKTDAAFEGGRLGLGRCRTVPQRPAGLVFGVIALAWHSSETEEIDVIPF